MSKHYESVATPAGRVLVPVPPPTPKKIVYEIIDGSNLMPHYGKYPSCATISDAVPYVGGYDYLVAVENGWMRQLTMEEEAELQSCMDARLKSAPIPSVS
jgi:hypothetical protein